MEMAFWRKYETEEQWKARPRIGDPGCTIDDLALKPIRARQDHALGYRSLPQEQAYSGNVINLAERRIRRLSER